jgi:hypothetical protein
VSTATLPSQSSRLQRENGQACFPAAAPTLRQAAANSRHSSAAKNLALFLLLAAFVFLAAAFVTLWSATLLRAALPSLHGRWRATLLRGTGTAHLLRRLIL